MDDIFNKACKAANMGNYEYAVELFREVLRRQPEHPEARLLLRGTERRYAAEHAGRMAAVMAHIRSAVPLLRALLTRSDPVKRLERCENALERIPSSLLVLHLAGRSARRAGLNDAAVAVFKDIILLDPDNKKALRQLGELLEERGEIREALKYLTRLRQLSPTDSALAASVKNLEAEAHMRESKMDEAESFRDMIKDQDVAEDSVKRFETAEEKRERHIRETLEELKQEPDNINKIVRLATLFQDAGQVDRAIKLLDKARQKYPDNFDLRQKVGDLQLQTLQDRERAARHALNASPDDAALRDRVETLARQRRALAVQEFRWRVEKHPTDRHLRLKLGHALLESGEVDGAIAAFQQAGQDATQELEAATMLGRCFARKQQYDLAIEQFRRALARHKAWDEKGMDLHYELASALENDGDVRQALDIFKRLYSSDIGFRDVADKLETLKTR